LSQRPPVEVYEALPSTNLEARRRGEAGEAGPVWITAERQTAGRGRRGRSWSTQEGNLAATLLTTTSAPAVQAAQVSFLAALAAADLADACLPPGAARVKWPNDVLVFGRKAVGILVESGAREAGGLWLAIGIGVNLAHHPSEVERPATSFAEHMASPPPKPLEALDILAGRFESWRRIWEVDGFAPIAHAWTERAYGLGEVCEVRLAERSFHGRAEALEPDGALRVRLADGGLERVTAGDVFFGGG
jgi:BirA family biotin operon repressor/biotin-[acetyl-CoA-carboxylase] ligase